MVRPNVVAAKLAELTNRIARIRRLCPPSPTELAANQDVSELVAFNLMLAVQSCADLASHIASDERWPVASTLADSFRRLHEEGVISQETSAALAGAVGLRNLVAHGYGGVDVERLHTAARNGVGDLDRFAREVAAWIRGREAP